MKKYLTFLLIVSSYSFGFTNDRSFLLTSNEEVEGISLSIKVYLEGALMNNGNQISLNGHPLMRDNLRKNKFNTQNYIPLLDPYKYPMEHFDITSKFLYVMPASFVGLDKITDSLSVFSVTGDNAIVDWVFIELRSPDDSTEIIASRGALLQRDGDVVDVDGISLVNFPGVTADYFYVVIRHRFHLGVMSKLVSANQLVDFTSPNTAVFNYGVIDGYDYTEWSMNPYVKLGYRALWGGDLNTDGRIKFDNPNDDLSVLFFDVFTYPLNTNGVSSYNFAYGYFNSDFDMNSNVKFDNPFDDKNMLFSQILFYPLNNSFYSNFNLFIEQVPK